MREIWASIVFAFNFEVISSLCSFVDISSDLIKYLFAWFVFLEAEENFDIFENKYPSQSRNQAIRKINMHNIGRISLGGNDCKSVLD